MRHLFGNQVIKAYLQRAELTLQLSPEKHQIMIREYYLVINIFLLLFSTLVSGQKGADVDYKLHLQNGLYSPKSNLSNYIPNQDFTRDELIAGKYYRILQFEEIPNAATRQEIANSGIDLLSYLPDYAYLAAIPTDIEVSLLKQFKLRSIIGLDWHHKLSPRLLDLHLGNEQLPKTLALRFPENVESAVITHLLQRKDIEVLGHLEEHHLFYISSKNIQLENLAKKTLVYYLDEVPDEITAEDNIGRTAHRSNAIMNTFPGGNFYDGRGVHVALGDDGSVGPHIDFQGRTEQLKSSGTLEGNHGEITAGILAGAGNLDPDKRGAAPGAFLHIFNGFEAITGRDGNQLFDDIVITSVSYGDGCNRGYTANTELADRQIRQSPELIHVFSAGNSGTDNCNYGAGEGWGNITGGIKSGKNVIAVGNLNYDFERVNSSSRGPTKDGRIKPDLSALGTGLFSTAPNNEYVNASGTSVAAPNVAGIMAQLYQAYRDLNEGLNPESALIKAAILNTCRDLGPKGPDFSYGWGAINALRAFDLIKKENYQKGTLDHGQQNKHTIVLPNEVRELRIMLYWTDHEGTPFSSKALVNDLELRFSGMAGRMNKPWVPNHYPHRDSLSKPAQPGEDHLNNVEQIVLKDVAVGIYEINVSGFEIPKGPQDYYVVYEWYTDTPVLTYPFGGESFQPGSIERIHWDASGDHSAFRLFYSEDQGQSWTFIDEVAGKERTYDWTVPVINTANARIKVERDGFEDFSNADFCILKSPSNLKVLKVCPEYIRLSWDELPEANHYVVYQLGDHFMDSLLSTSVNAVNIPNLDPTVEQWFAIRAIDENGAMSKRTIAVSSGGEIKDCSVERDIAVAKVNSPADISYKNCLEEELPVSINFKNEGTTFLSNFSICYELNNSNTTCELYLGMIPPGITINYQFASTLPDLNPGNHQLKVWLGLNEDEAHYNDTVYQRIRMYSGELVSLPYAQSFEEFDLCHTDERCLNPCPLAKGWTNASNILDDQIDWQVFSGATPTFATGPEFDQNTQAPKGQYLYLDGSGGCFERTASLLSPCINLKNEDSPIFSFWYHMFGEDMGALYVDLFDGTDWHNNIYLPIKGNKGNTWQKAEVDLQNFIGKIINVRFRGETGKGHLTDIAIDNIGFFNRNTPPIPNFTLNKFKSCTGEIVKFTDNSFNLPTAWKWTFNPSTVEYVGGTSNESANPQVIFKEEGSYNVHLAATNSYGTGELATLINFLEVDNGHSLPFRELFNSYDQLMENNWSIVNPDDEQSWDVVSATGANGEPTFAASVSNHNYNANGEEDELHSVNIDISNIEEPFLRFDYSYARFNPQAVDGLQVWLSPSCGAEFSELIFSKFHQDLATVDFFANSWIPTTAADWKTAVIDLTDYKDASIQLKFININGFGNNIYLDNVLVYEKAAFPQAAFSHLNGSDTICLEEKITFVDQTLGGDKNQYKWNFGQGAVPSQAIGIGPHDVQFPQAGLYTINLEVSNELGQSKSTQKIRVLPDTDAGFSYDIQGEQVSFFNESVNAENYQWDFGDGNTSIEKDPIHNFGVDATYKVKLIAYNYCGLDEAELELKITTSIGAVTDERQLLVYPNPTNRLIFIEPRSNTQLEGSISIYDINGRRVFYLENTILLPTKKYPIDLSMYSKGAYFLKIQEEEEIRVQRIILH